MSQFDRHAAAYDAVRTRVVYPEALFDHLRHNARAHGRALDLGCGTGTSTSHLVGSFRAVDGIDLGARLVERARANVPGATFFVSTAEAFEPAAPYDLVTCATAFYWMDRDAVLAKLPAWLGPGGIFCAYRYEFPIVYGPLRDVVERELALRWSRYRDPRLVDYDDTLERMQARPALVEARRLVFPNVLAFTPREVGSFFLSTSYVTRFIEEEGGASYAEELMARIEAADPSPAVRVNFDVHAFFARVA